LLRIAVVSGSSLIRAGLRVGLEQAGDFEVVHACGSLAELAGGPGAVADVLVAQGDEDLLAELARHRLHGMPPLVVLAQGDSECAEWLAEGVSIVAGDASPGVIAAAARCAAAGLACAPPDLLSAALRFARWPPAEAPDARQAGLTPREVEVLAKLAEGLGNKAIAQELHISAHTAKFHVAQIIAKLDASSRAHAVAKALRAGLIQD